MRTYLIRHPRPDVAAGICYGRSDLGLAEDARACAAGLLTLLPATAPVYASPLTRCRQLAEQLHAAPVFDARLLEIDFGRWEMTPWQAIDRATFDAWSADPLGFTPPGGESVAALQRRVGAFLAERAAAGEREVVMVVHAGVMKVCLAELLGMPQQEWFAFSFEFGSATLIEDGRLLWHNRRHG